MLSKRLRSLKRLLNKLVLILTLLSFAVLSTGSLRFYTLLLGVIISVIMTLLFENALIKRSLSIRDALRLLHLVKYLLYFIYVEIKAHVELSKIILLGKHVKPAIVAVPYSIESDYGLAMVALSVTNTPGTIVVHVDKKSRTMFIHWINATTFDSYKAREEISRGFEEIAKRIFG